jgi:cell wall assembly regulator SMI1
MSILNSISSFFDDLTTTRRHAAKKRPVRSTSPSRLPFYTNGHQQSSSTNNLPLTRPGTPLPTSLILGPINTNKTSWESSPSLRSASQITLRVPSPSHQSGSPRKSTGIQLQELSPNGVQPPPPVVDSWARIDAWTESHYPELYDQLSYPATPQDVDDLEVELDCTLPIDVRESLYVHDGQDRGGRPTGILFGVSLLDCEEIAQEWSLWKTVAQAYAHDTLVSNPPVSPASPLSPDTPVTPAESSRGRRQSKLFGVTARFRNCRPPGTIQPVYAHPAWIPLAKDFSGNNIAVDLSPGPRGIWGQVILFGQNCDTKYVVARSWASFLAAIAEDFDAGEARFDTDDGFRESFGSRELRIRPCHGARDDTFLEVLKARVRLRERELQRAREQREQKVVRKDSPTVDLMVNSPRMTGDGFPSPNLPRESESIAGSPVIGTPISTPTIALPRRKDTVTVSGPELLASVAEITRLDSAGDKALGSPILVKKVNGTEEAKTEETKAAGSDVLSSPILVKRSVAGTVEEEKASTGLGIEEGAVEDRKL